MSDAPSPSPSPARRRAAARLAVGALTAAALGACLEVATGPGGTTSLKLLPSPKSVVVGDSLRDSSGTPTPVRAEAFDANDQPVADSVVRFFYVPLRTDTSRRELDSALVVDSLTGAVRSPGPPRQARQGRVAVRVGSYQLIDTLQIVFPPDTLQRTGTADTVRLQYVCTDRTPTAQSDSSPTLQVRIGNVTPGLGTTLRADSSGTPVAVPRYLVGYRIDAGRTIPVGTTPAGTERPAIYMTGASTDLPLNYDTTATDGTVAPRLRVVPALMTTAAFPEDLTVLQVRASALLKRDTVPAPVRFVVLLQRRRTSVSTGEPLACP